MFKEMIAEIKKNTISPEDAAIIKDEAAWESAKQDEFGKGKIEGLKEGIKEGEIKGKIEGKIEAFLEVKFGEESLHFMPQILEINDIDKLTQILKAIKQAKSQSEFGKMLEEIIKSK